MIRFFIILPLLMCAFWWAYLRMKGFGIKDGAQGFKYIIAFNAIIISFFVILILVTDYP